MGVQKEGRKKDFASETSVTGPTRKLADLKRKLEKGRVGGSLNSRMLSVFTTSRSNPFYSDDLQTSAAASSLRLVVCSLT